MLTPGFAGTGMKAYNQNPTSLRTGVLDQVKKLWGSSKNISFVAKTDAYKWL